MFSNKYEELAKKYYVDHITSALNPGTRLSNSLIQLESSKPISDITQEFLRNQGLLTLLRYVRNEISLTDFLKLAPEEQTKQKLAAEAKAREEQLKIKQAEEALQIRIKLMQERQEAKKRAFDNDPKNINLRLRQKYDLLAFIEQADFSKLINILSTVDSGTRLAEEEHVWLLANKEDYFTQQLQNAYHKNEAEFYASEFKQRKDPWLAVNASAHYRKCREAETAELMLSTITLPKIKDVKLKSALCTTLGGVKRDLGKWDEALNLGEQAHLLTPKDFRPCTLLGAINIEIGNYDLGRAWYDKAVARGYTEKAVDDDLRRIFKRLEKSKQDKLRDYLLRTDPIRYSWASKK